VKITHVLVLGVPHPDGKQYEGQVYEADKLPEGFAIKGTYGDAFLTFRDDGTVRTACSRNFFEKREDGTWLRWPFLDGLSPEQALAQHREEERRG
jgi:hypothetical protein